jgi:predicted XRE-type DNA-binding protein/DNA-binding phage protein
MALTRDFRETIQARARRDAAFRKALLKEAVDSMLAGDVDTGKSVLRDYVNATIGFAALGAATGKSPKSLMRMLGPEGNPQARNLFEIVAYLHESEGVTRSSGNVFADLGLLDPEEELTKAQLASHLRQILKRRRLTQAAAAKLMGIDQPKVSALLNGRLANFSSERLMRLLTALGHDVEIAVSPFPTLRPHARIRVIEAAPGTHAPGFAEEARRQSLAVARSRHAKADQDFIDAVSDRSDE